MDVRCERCSTEYEFDDALVSGRGTTVKCTNCGHKFKIRRGDGDYSADFWNVETGDNRTLVFTSLRELQRAIQTHLVERSDKLSRGGLPPKPIGQIPELAPFFDQREEMSTSTTQPAALPSRKRTSRPPPPPGASTMPLAPPPRARQSTQPDFLPPPAAELPSMKQTIIGTGAADDAARIAIERADAAAAIRSAPPPSTDREPEPDTERFVRERAAVSSSSEVPRGSLDTRGNPVFSLPQHSPVPPAAYEVSSPLPPPTAPVRRSMRAELDEYAEPMRFTDPPASLRRRGVGGFIVVSVLLLSAAVIGAVWAKDRYGSALGIGKPVPQATADPRATALLATGEKALAEGNLDVAKENFDKASALAEKDPHVLLDSARLAALRADVPWLKSRLLPIDAADEHRLTRENLSELASAARKSADDASVVAPDDPAVIRAKIDALRISGDRDGARALVGKIASSASSPESAYVLAALDLAESEPLWSTVIDRLRAAASSEAGPGRARAALAYALARSGDAAAAKIEVDRLDGMPRRHPLLPLLRAYVDGVARGRSTSTNPPKLDGGVPIGSTVSVGELPDKKDPKDKPLSTDGRVLVAQGEAARARGELDRAQVLFAAALDKNASDTEALSGLASIAHSRHDLNGARASYKRVLSINPSYVPALVGLGDVDWESGDRASAMKTYKEIVDRFPEGTYPARVRTRLEPAPAPAPTPAPTDSSTGAP